MTGEGERRQRRDRFSPRDRVGDATRSLREAQPDGVLTRQHVGREQHGPGRPLAGQARQPRRRPLVDHEAQLGRGDPERGVGCGNPEVAGDGELGAGTEGGALDRRDHRHRRVTDAEQQATQRRLERLVLDAGQIGAGTEVPAGASDDDHARPFGDGSGDGDGQLGGVVDVDRVASLRPVDGDDSDVAAAFGRDGHRGVPTTRR